MRLPFAGRHGLAAILKGEEEAGFAAAALRGENVDALIAAENDAAVLRKAVDRARRYGEMQWGVACTRRLVEIAPDPNHLLLHAQALIATDDLAEARQLLDDIDASVRTGIEFGTARGALLAVQGRAEEAFDVFRALETSAGDIFRRTAVLRIAETVLAKRPAVTAAPLLRLYVAQYPRWIGMRSLLARCELYLGDTERAVELVNLPENELTAAPVFERQLVHEAQAEILSYRGRLDELFDLAKSCIVRNPGHWRMYAAAAEIAVLIWRDREFDELIAAIPKKFLATADAMSIRLRRVAETGDSAAVDRLLPKLRARSARHYAAGRFLQYIQQGSLAQIESAYEDCVTCRLDQLAAVLHAVCVYHYAMDAERLAVSRSRMEAVGDAAFGNVAYWLYYLRLLVALGDTEAARRCFAELPAGLRSHARLKPFSMYFEAAAGHDREATTAWRDYIADSRHFSVNTRTRYPITVDLKYIEKPGDILVFGNVHNGMAYVDWFLRHYRALGVDHFFLLDNNSTDGTAERLRGEPDVSLFRNPDGFAASGFGVVWTNHQLQRFGLGHWCFHLDFDEGFVFPGQDRGASLRDFLGYLDRQGYEAVLATELDMYPERLTGEVDGNPFDLNSYFDSDYVSLPSELPPYVLIRGGLRQRMTGRAEMMHKTPLVRVTADTRFVECNHCTTHQRVADVTTAVLHYKFVGDFYGRLDETIRRGEHFAGAISYRKLQKSGLKLNDDGSLLSEFSRRYTGPASLEAEGLIRSSPAWEAHLGGKAASAATDR